MENVAPPKVLSEPTEIDLTGMMYPEKDGQPVLLNIEGSPLLYVGIYRTEERLKKSMIEIKKEHDNIKQITHGGEFESSIPENITIIIDPRLTERGTVRYTQVQRM